MGMVVDRHKGTALSEQDLITRLRAEGLVPHGWSNGPGDTYGWHEHAYEKVLYCVEGRIVFHTDDGDAALGPGDRLVLAPLTPHAATVGTEGVRCVEASRSGASRSGASGSGAS